MFSMDHATPTDRCEGDDECRLVVCDIVQTSMLQVERPGCFVDICELHFPAVVPYADIYSIEIRSDPYPSAFIDGNVLNTQSSSSSSTHCNDVPFSVAPMSRVFVITIGAQANAIRRRGGRGPEPGAQGKQGIGLVGDTTDQSMREDNEHLTGRLVELSFSISS